ncbi:unnamed protein product [Spodoptera exigua]|nr:unnamed protein product [Spodoptera exigua]
MKFSFTVWLPGVTRYHGFNLVDEKERRVFSQKKSDTPSRHTMGFVELRCGCKYFDLEQDEERSSFKSFIVTTLQVDHWNETSRQTQARQAIDAERHAAQRAAETSQQSQPRQIIDAERHADQRAAAAETSQHTQARQILDAEHQASYIAAETSEETRRRRLINAERQRRRTFTMNTWEAFADAAFDYDLLLDFFNHRLVLIGRMANKCRHCEALKWKEETLGMCCPGGKVSVPTLGDPEEQRQKKGQQ